MTAPRRPRDHCIRRRPRHGVRPMWRPPSARDLPRPGLRRNRPACWVVAGFVMRPSGVRSGSRRSTAARLWPWSPSRQGGAAAAGGGLQAASYVRLAEPAAQFGGDGGGVLRRDEDAGHAAVGGAADRLRQAADVRGHDRDAPRECLGHRHAVRLGVGGEDHQVGGGVAGVEFGAGLRARQVQPVLEAVLARSRDRSWATYSGSWVEAADAARSSTAGRSPRPAPPPAGAAPCAGSRRPRTAGARRRRCRARGARCRRRGRRRGPARGRGRGGRPGGGPPSRWWR